MSRTMLVGLLGALAVALAAGMIYFNDPPAPPDPRKTSPSDSKADSKAARSRERRAAAPALRPLPEAHPAPAAPAETVAGPPPPRARLAKAPDRAGPDKRPPAPPPPKSRSAKPQARNPEAREALSRVGFDPAAEAVWFSAINDPDLPQEERKDLIEDLNEDGFPDPKNITEADLPLILSRLELIEELVPKAMDEVNDAAFREAYKDLMNMYLRLTGQ